MVKRFNLLFLLVLFPFIGYTQSYSHAVDTNIVFTHLVTVYTFDTLKSAKNYRPTTTGAIAGATTIVPLRAKGYSPTFDIYGGSRFLRADSGHVKEFDTTRYKPNTIIFRYDGINYWYQIFNQRK
jgi:hypothetical protein